MRYRDCFDSLRNRVSNSIAGDDRNCDESTPRRNNNRIETSSRCSWGMTSIFHCISEAGLRIACILKWARLLILIQLSILSHAFFKCEHWLVLRNIEKVQVTQKGAPLVRVLLLECADELACPYEQFLITYRAFFDVCSLLGWNPYRYMHGCVWKNCSENELLSAHFAQSSVHTCPLIGPLQCCKRRCFETDLFPPLSCPSHNLS